MSSAIFSAGASTGAANWNMDKRSCSIGILFGSALLTAFPIAYTAINKNLLSKIFTTCCQPLVVPPSAACLALLSNATLSQQVCDELPSDIRSLTISTVGLSVLAGVFFIGGVAVLGSGLLGRCFKQREYERII